MYLTVEKRSGHSQYLSGSEGLISTLSLCIKSEGKVKHWPMQPLTRNEWSEHSPHLLMYANIHRIIPFTLYIIPGSLILIVTLPQNIIPSPQHRI